MSHHPFYDSLTKELERIDTAHITKRNERTIESFTKDPAPKACINGKEYRLFNSNDYLGLRFHPALKKAEQKASETFGTGPGAVRFISGTLAVHRQLEQKTASFHKREDAIIFSSAFAANLAVMFCLSQGLTKDSLIDSDVLIISDALNHRSIIDGVRLTGIPKEQRIIFEHMNAVDLQNKLQEYKGRYKRVIVVTDGVFSMLGEYQKLKHIRQVIDQEMKNFSHGILLVVDDCHGVGIAGTTGRGIEEIEGVHADILVGTYGKAFGADGGYVVGDQVLINYLRESAATYIYSNSISPGTAAAAKQAIEVIDSPEGQKFLSHSQKMTSYFKQEMTRAGYTFAADSIHPIQPVLIGDTAKTKKLVENLFSEGFLVTNISYPVVPKGRDEIRVQISASHTKDDIDRIVQAFAKYKID
jgi:glycine C-acetyltransferase